MDMNAFMLFFIFVSKNVSIDVRFWKYIIEDRRLNRCGKCIYMIFKICQDSFIQPFYNRTVNQYQTFTEVHLVMKAEVGERGLSDWKGDKGHGRG